MNRAHKIVRQKNHGFTLVELIVVIAILLVLAAACVPVLGRYLERAMEAEDVANVREAYTEVLTEAISNEEADPITVPLKQGKDDFQCSEEVSIAGITKADTTHWIGYPHAGGSAKVSYDPELGVIINWNAGAVISSIGIRTGNYQTANGRYSYFAAGNNAISTYNSEGKNGFYELESGKTYTISCTYALQGSGCTGRYANYGLMPGAVLLFDQSNKVLLDAGKSTLNLSDKSTQEALLCDNSSNAIEGTSYKYTYNEKDNTYTYTATFTAPETADGKCYLGMNYFFRDLNNSQKTADLSNYGDYESAQNQIRQSFTVEEAD